MKLEILHRIQALGGTIENGNSLLETLQGIKFNHPLYGKSWKENVFGIDDFYKKNEKSYQQDKDVFYKKLVAHFFSNHELPYGQCFYKGNLFTPLTEGTADYEEWKDIFEEEEMTDLSKIKKVTDGGKLEFVEIVFSYGFPDAYYVCLSDSNPENPIVFGTDHEEFFMEISNEGTVEGFFNQFYTQTEFLKIVKDYIENEKLHNDTKF